MYASRVCLEGGVSGYRARAERGRAERAIRR